MLVIRLYISALTLIFLLVLIMNRGLSVLAGVVISCALISLVLDARDELRTMKLELRALQDLEQRISELLQANQR